MAEIPTIPPAPIDIRTAIELDRAMYERAQQLAGQGAALARESGLKTKGLAVADDVTVADTLVRLAREREAEAVVVGANGHSALREFYSAVPHGRYSSTRDVRSSSSGDRMTPKLGEKAPSRPRQLH